MLFQSIDLVKIKVISKSVVTLDLGPNYLERGERGYKEGKKRSRVTTLFHRCDFVKEKAISKSVVTLDLFPRADFDARKEA